MAARQSSCTWCARGIPFDFRMFLQRHGALLRALPEWRIRLLVPAASERRRGSAMKSRAGTSSRRPLQPDALEELRWYFERRRALGKPRHDSTSSGTAEPT